MMDRFAALVCLAIAALPVAVFAEDDDAGLRVELNAADTAEGSCRLTFLLQNSLDQGIEALVAETVLFSDQGGVVMLTLFDFQDVPSSRPRVRQFQVLNQSCDEIGQVLINGFNTCQIDGTASDLCQDTLQLGSRTSIKLKG